MYNYEINATTNGIYTIGISPSGQVNISIEGGTGATLGRMNAASVFQAYENGAVLGNTSTVVACGNGTILAVNVTGAPCVIVTKAI